MTHISPLSGLWLGTFLRSGVVPFLIALSLLSFSCQHRSPLLIKKHRILMGTLVEISVIGRDAAKVGISIDDAFEEMERIEGLMSRRIPGNDVSRVNGWAGIKPVDVSAEVLEVIQRANGISRASGGYFDITVGALLDLWGFEGDEGHLPSQDEVAQVLHSVGYKGVQVDEAASTVELRGKGMRIDLGGIAKGYAVDQAFELLALRGYRNMIVNAGGDMRVGGKKIDGPWVVGIQDPRDRSRILATFEAVDMCVATSGDYERYFMRDGNRYHHLLNPFTGYPARKCRSVTILAGDALSADGLATAVFVMGPTDGLRLIEGMEGTEALIVSSDGEIILSEGLRGKLQFAD